MKNVDQRLPLWPIFALWLAFILGVKLIEGMEYRECLRQGGSVVLGWLQDGCENREASQ